MAWGPLFRHTRRIPRGTPGDEGYKPKLNRDKAPTEPVPEHLRGVRLSRRRRKPRMRGTPLVVRFVLLIAIVAFVLVVWAVFKGPAV